MDTDGWNTHCVRGSDFVVYVVKAWSRSFSGKSDILEQLVLELLTNPVVSVIHDTELDAHCRTSCPSLSPQPCFALTSTWCI